MDRFVHAVYGVDSLGSKSQKNVFAGDRLLASTRQGSVFMAGDTLSDILAAKEASVTSAVTWGDQSLKKLFLGNPDFVVSSDRELIDVIEQ